MAPDEIELLLSFIADFIRDNLDLNMTRKPGVEAYLASGEFRLLVDHLVAGIVLSEDAKAGTTPARMCAAGLRQFVPGDALTDAFETSFFSVVASACRLVVGTYLPKGYRPGTEAVDTSYLQQLKLSSRLLRTTSTLSSSAIAPTWRTYEQFFTKSLRAAKQNHAKVVPRHSMAPDPLPSIESTSPRV